MNVRGEVFSGTLRGTPLVEKYYPRLVGLLKFKPYKGTMDVKLERNVDVRGFATKSIEHVLTDGKKKVDAYIAPVRIRKLTVVYKLMQVRESEKQILQNLKKLEKAAEEKLSLETEEIEEPTFICWAMQFKNGIYGSDILELISEDSIKEKLSIEDGDKIEIEFLSEEKNKKSKHLPVPLIRRKAEDKREAKYKEKQV